MLGAIAGDIIGSPYEFGSLKTTEFPLFSHSSRFTDDSVMTVAVAYALLHGEDYAGAMQDFGKRYPHAGYGGMFQSWLHSPDPQPYNSFGNGSAMRASPAGWAFDTVDEVLAAAKRTAAPTHNHPEGIKGAQATALAILMARQGSTKGQIKTEITTRFGYDLAATLDEIRPDYTFNETCQDTVPQALIAFLESTGYEDAIRKAVSLGGDADTLACITGGIAEAFYGGLPPEIAREARARLPEDLLVVMDEFCNKYVNDRNK